MPSKATQDTSEPKVELSAYTPDPQSTDPIDIAIREATTRIAAKKRVQADLQQSRDFLNAAVGAGVGSDDQKQWINDHLPKRTRNRNGSTDD